jgi:large subunit ribosomal protein L33
MRGKPAHGNDASARDSGGLLGAGEWPEGGRPGPTISIASGGRGGQSLPLHSLFAMAQDIICLECTEARKEGKPPSRYFSTRNKKLQTEKVERKKFNKFLRRHTLHKEVKH